MPFQRITRPGQPLSLGRARGQAATEYILLTAMVAGLLFVMRSRILGILVRPLGEQAQVTGSTAWRGGENRIEAHSAKGRAVSSP